MRVFRFAIVVSCIAALTTPTFAAEPPAGLDIQRSRKTGLATFVRATHGGAIDSPVAVARGGVQSAAMDFVVAHGHLFGINLPDQELVLRRVAGDELAGTHTVYDQMFRGVPVFGGRLQVHQNSIGAVTAANGHVFPIPQGLRVRPSLDAQTAVDRARAILPAANTVVEKNELTIVDPGWYGDASTGARLAWHLILNDEAVGIREAFFVDAHTGKILDHWNVLHTIKNRQVFNDVSGLTVRVEGGPATGDSEADGAYDYSGDTYDYLFRAFGRDSIDDNGAILFSTIRLQSSSCPNAFGGTGGTSYCNGVVTDDIVAHEFTHGLTGFTAGLIYQNQPGQINESFSDVFGEVVDLLNGDAAFAGTPGGTPWPPHASGHGSDEPNDLRTACVAPAFVTVNAPGNIAGDYQAQPASFGVPLLPGGTSADLVVANPIRGCNADLPFSNAGEMAGNIVLMNRGDCTFAEKVKNAQNAGAIGAIIANNNPIGPAPMGGSDPTITIRAVGVTQADGATMRDEDLATNSVNVTLRTNVNPDVRWLVGEDSAGFGGAIRDMWLPSCMGDPDDANHPLQVCAANDNGGVHSGSGIPNHAFAMAVDGQTYNAITVQPIGLFKAAAVWYRALTVYLTPTSDFGDAYAALNQSASDLIGQMIKDPRDGSDYAVFTSEDAAEINNALLAVEMNTLGLCGANELLDPTPPTLCPGRTTVYANPINPGGTAGWTVQNSNPPTPYNWVLDSTGLPNGHPGTVWFAEDRNIGDCGGQDESGLHTLFTTTVALPGVLQSPTVMFTHYVSTEAGYDGGNVKISVNGGAWQLIPASAYTFNPYNTVMVSAANGNTSPIAGEPGWTGGQGLSNDWGTSLIDISSFVSPGDTVRFRFDFGKDGCAGVDGWYVDDFEIFTCPLEDCNENEVPDTTDIANSTSADCDLNGTPDECQIAVGSPAPGGPFFCTADCDPDCNVNAIPDSCEISGNDCNANLIPDTCELSDCAGDPACDDCDGNTLLDACDLLACAGDPQCSDCNGNGVPDSCDIIAGAADGNGDGIPDQCQVPSVVPEDPPSIKTRFISFSVPAVQVAGGGESALRVRLVSLHHVVPPYSGAASIPFTAFEGQTRWVGPAASYVESTSNPIPFRTASLQCDPHYEDWSTVGLLHVTGSAIVPSSMYELENVASSCQGAEESCTSVSPPVSIGTTRWGDVESPYNPPSATVQPDVTDIGALVNKFRSAPGSPNKARALLAGEPGLASGEITPAVLSVDLNFSHISACVDAFRGAAYPYTIQSCP